MGSEIIFLVEKAADTARALGHSVFTEADTWEELRTAVQDAIRTHFDEDNKPAILETVVPG